MIEKWRLMAWFGGVFTQGSIYQGFLYPIFNGMPKQPICHGMGYGPRVVRSLKAWRRSSWRRQANHLSEKRWSWEKITLLVAPTYIRIYIYNYIHVKNSSNTHRYQNHTFPLYWQCSMSWSAIQRLASFGNRRRRRSCNPRLLKSVPCRARQIAFPFHPGLPCGPCLWLLLATDAFRIS